MANEVLEDSLQFSDVAKDSIQSFLDEIVRHWEGVRGGQDVEALHDMRVATRRLRASLSVFQPIFEQRPFEKFERKISYLTDALGDARDTDVFIEFLRAQIVGLSVEQTSEEYGLSEFIKFLQKKRDEQQVDLLKTLRRLDPAELLHDGQRLLTNLPGQDLVDGEPAHV
jgi:CHAD domain-containing protein